MNMIAKVRLFLTTDAARLVDEGDVDAAMLYAAPGDEIPDSAAELFGLVDGCLTAESALSMKARGLEATALFLAQGAIDYKIAADEAAKRALDAQTAADDARQQADAAAAELAAIKAAVPGDDSAGGDTGGGTKEKLAPANKEKPAPATKAAGGSDGAPGGDAGPTGGTAGQGIGA